MSLAQRLKAIATTDRGPAGDKELSADPDCAGFVTDACRHLKPIAVSGAPKLTLNHRLTGIPGITEIMAAEEIELFISIARRGKVWERDSE